ncbi:TonB-dependent siderophore receptor [Rhizobium paknamense]|uniref:Iron complex outermembrane receptor protein n=1 Tax=Rhizobium paknamense TaxID=1206817 RepID=A0ABU0IFR5_9HYPH|nr:TonB-dependent siderophore receptor [Rhizobium paknamense]MDQ0457083.1 iron complex outermembrane receptor protein [Rhizobium paknamense]
MRSTGIAPQKKSLKVRASVSHTALLAGLAGFGLPLLTLPALAEDGVTDLPTIVVTGKTSRPVGPDDSIVAKETLTGTKTDTPIIDIPSAVSVVTVKELEKRKVTDLQEAVSYTAGVLTDEFGSDDRYDYFRIRGFDSTTLGTYRDGLNARIPAWYTAARVEPYGLERVEVLKGSTSSLFGLNSPGGLINAITKRPQDTPHAEVYTTLGDHHVETGTDFGGPIDPDGVFSYRVTAKWQNADLGRDYSNDNRVYVAPALTISPDASTSFTLLTDYNKRKTSPATGIPQGVNLDIGTFLGEPDYNKFNTTQKDIGYLFSHEFDNGLTFRQTARYSHVDLDYQQVYGATTDASADRSAFAVKGKADRFAIDNQLEYDYSSGIHETKTLIGTDFAYDDTAEDIDFGTAKGIDIYNPSYCGLSCINASPWIYWRVKQAALGVYAQEQWTIDDRWMITAGGRYDYVNTKADYLLTGTSDNNTAEAFTKRIGLSYKITPELAAYANYSTSFQPLVTPTANGYSVGGSLKSQQGEQYEIGMKYKPDSFDALFTMALFDLTQTNVPANVTPVLQRQIGKVGVRGVELEAKMALDDRWNATLAYSYWDGKIKEDGTSGNAGNRPERVPDHIASAWLDYTIPGNGQRGDLNIGGGVRYIGSSFGDAANTVKVGGYTVFDAAVTYKATEHVTLALNAKNLFDREYATTCYFGTCYYGDRRTVLGTVKVSW